MASHSGDMAAFCPDLPAVASLLPARDGCVSEAMASPLPPSTQPGPCSQGAFLGDGVSPASTSSFSGLSTPLLGPVLGWEVTGRRGACLSSVPSVWSSLVPAHQAVMHTEHCPPRGTGRCGEARSGTVLDFLWAIVWGLDWGWLQSCAPPHLPAEPALDSDAEVSKYSPGFWVQPLCACRPCTAPMQPERSPPRRC